MRKSWVFIYAIVCATVLIITAGTVHALLLPPYRIAGYVFVDGEQLTKETDTGYVFTVTREDNTPYNPEADCRDGLKPNDAYFIDIPIQSADQPGGAVPGETALIHVYKNNVELEILSPQGGRITIGNSAETDEPVNIEARTVSSGTIPPVADAGEDSSGCPGDEISLDGSLSHDPDSSQALTCFWEQIDGPPVTIENPDMQTTSFTIPENAQNGDIFQFELMVRDGDGLEDTDTVTVQVDCTAAPVPPAAVAPENLNVREGDIVVLDGSDSNDPDGEIVSYQWAQVSGETVEITGQMTAQAEFTAPEKEHSPLVFTLTVTDNDGLTDTCEVAVTISDAPVPPVAVVADSLDVREGDIVVLDGSDSNDPDGQIVSYRWAQISGEMVEITGQMTARAEFTAPAKEDSPLVFSLTITDDDGLTDSKDVEVNIVSADPPVADAGGDQTVVAAGKVDLDGQDSYDPDGEIVSFFWEQVEGKSVELVSPDAAETSFSISNCEHGGQTLVFLLTVTDEDGLTGTDRVSVQITENSSPNALITGPAQVYAGEDVTLSAQGSHDTDGTISAYFWQQTGGPDVPIPDPGQKEITFATHENLGGKTLSFLLRVTDNCGATGQKQTSVMVKQISTEAPIVSIESVLPARPGDLVTLDGSGSRDPDGQIVDFLWEQISGTPVSFSDPHIPAPVFTVPDIQSSEEILVFRLTVTDNSKLTGQDQISISVRGNKPPYARAGEDMRTSWGRIVELSGSTSYDPDGSVVSYEWKQTMGTQVSLSDSYVEDPTFVAPEPETNGETLRFELVVTDNQGARSSDTVDVFVFLDNISPVADAGNDRTVERGSSVVLDAGSSFDQDGKITSYYWKQTQGEEVVLSMPLSEKCRFEAPDVEEGETKTLVFSLTVTDDDGASHADSVKITVAGYNPGNPGNSDGMHSGTDEATGDMNHSCFIHSMHDCCRSIPYTCLFLFLSFAVAAAFFANNCKTR